MPRLTAIILLLASIVATLQLGAISGCSSSMIDGKIATAAKTPKAVVPESIYRFDPVDEGTDIQHDFVIENRGQAPLVIEKVQPDCSCSVASNPGQIPPGGKDAISVVIHTRFQWGQTITKSFRMTTNDPQASEIELVVTGKIQGFYIIEPDRVKLTGHQGDKDLKQQISIAPNRGRLFNVKNTKINREDERIHLTLAPQGKETPPQNGYLLTVSCDAQQQGSIKNLILIETDLEGAPTIRIPVMCQIHGAITKKEP